MSILYVLLSVHAAFAAWDSVAVFHRPNRVVIQINERGAVSRLQSFMDLSGPGRREFVMQSADAGVKFDCGRNEEAASCILRLLPSAHVNIGAREVIAETALAEIGLPDTPYAASFLNSNGDYLHLTIESGRLRVHAGKRNR